LHYRAFANLLVSIILETVTTRKNNKFGSSNAFVRRVYVYSRLLSRDGSLLFQNRK